MLALTTLSYNFTKSKITTGLRCPKTLLFDINEKIDYLQLVFASSIGILVFTDSLDPMLFNGGSIIVSSGLLDLQRERKIRSR